MNQETKVGVFLIVAVAVLTASSIFLGNVKLFDHSRKYYADFRNVEALPPKAVVKVAGVEIGKVSRIELVQGHARIALAITDKLPLYANARAKIGSTGIIGTRFVELNPGTPDAGILKEKSVIPGEEGASLDAMLEKISSLFDEDARYGSATDNLKQTIANLRDITNALNAAVGQRSEDLSDIVSNLKEISEHTKVFTAHLQEISTASKDDVKEAIKKFRDIGDKVDAMMAKIQRGEGTVGALINDDKTAQDVKDSIASIKDTAASAKKVIGRFTQIQTYWNFRDRYDFRDDENRVDAGITIVPRPGKFYSVGITNVGEMPHDEKHTAFERKNRITAVMGADWGPFTGYAGALRSSGGFGLSLRPLFRLPSWNHRLELNVEAMDFNRDRTVLGRRLDSAFVLAGAHVAVTRWLWLGARVEDVLERASFMLDANVTFRDEDLAYILGLASISRP